jgi:hypothetical protein
MLNNPNRDVSPVLNSPLVADLADRAPAAASLKSDA